MEIKYRIKTFGSKSNLSYQAQGKFIFWWFDLIDESMIRCGSRKACYKTFGECKAFIEKSKKNDEIITTYTIV